MADHTALSHMMACLPELFIITLDKNGCKYLVVCPLNSILNNPLNSMAQLSKFSLFRPQSFSSARPFGERTSSVLLWSESPRLVASSHPFLLSTWRSLMATAGHYSHPWPDCLSETWLQGHLLSLCLGGVLRQGLGLQLWPGLSSSRCTSTWR